MSAAVKAYTGRYFCADGRHIPEGHDAEECPPCLRAQRDGIRREYEANVRVDLVGRLREMDRRIRAQRDELARLNAQVARPPSPMRVADAYDAWEHIDLSRAEGRLAYCAFRAGWAAARRALSLAAVGRKGAA